MKSVHAFVTATDLSAPSRHAVQRAALLAKASGAQMTLMHARAGFELGNLRRWLARDAGNADAIDANATLCLEALATELSQRHGIDVATHLSTGSPVKQIVRHAADVDADLLVTGSRGSFFRGALIGSTAEHIAKRSSRPVLMVRQPPRDAYQRILIPVDFSPWSRSAIELAQKTAPTASLVLMHAVQPPHQEEMRLTGVAEPIVKRYRDAAIREATQRLHVLAADAGLDSTKVQLRTPSGGRPCTLILREAQAQGCDLVVISRQGRNALAEFLLGSTTRTVVAQGSVDVLISSH